MPFDFDAVIHKQYESLPVPPDLISAKGNGIQHIMWVGCSDSVTLDTFALDVPREELFVHRNLGNVLSNGDLSSESAVAWAIDLLKVEHIIVCGHYGCSMTKEKDPTALAGWSKDIAKLHKLNDEFLEKVDEASRERRLEDVYTLAEKGWLERQPNVKTAMRERGLQIHAFVYDKEKNACVRLLETGTDQKPGTSP